MKSKETAMDPTKRQPFVRGLWGVRYQVKDVQRSISFYTQTLGFNLDRQLVPAAGRFRWMILTVIRSSCSSLPDDQHGHHCARLAEFGGYATRHDACCSP